MSGEQIRIATDEQRQWLRAAKDSGGLCAGCGRTLDPDEPIYIERIEVERKPLAGPGAYWGQHAAYRDVPLGAECASATFLADTRGRPPEECGGCGRPVYYEVGRWGRQWVSCSRRCNVRRSRKGGWPE